MSETEIKQNTTAEKSVPSAAQHDARIDVSAQLVELEPGLYNIQIAAKEVVRTQRGMVLPAVRFDTLPPTGNGRAHLSSLTDSSLILAGAPPAFLRVSEGRVPVLITIYKLHGPMQPPDIQMTPMIPVAKRGAGAELAEFADRLPSLPVKLLVHMEFHGDVQVDGGAWARAPKGEAAIEGFSITPGGNLPADLLEYQAVLGQDWLSPQMASGEFCGSRQMALALLGVKVAVKPEYAARYHCQVWGRFDGQELGPFENGAVCESAGARLTGLRVTVLEIQS